MRTSKQVGRRGVKPQLRCRARLLIPPRAFGIPAMVAVVALSGVPARSEVQEDYYFNEVPTVLSVTRLKQPLSDTPASVTIINQDMIRASGALNIPDLLRLVPGFQVAFIFGKTATATAHGRGDAFARDMQVTIDGRSVYDPVFGGVSWQNLQLDMDDIQRIEVIRGPNAASYGSNSFAGVINIITEHPALQQGVRLKSRFGTGKNHYQTGRYTGSAGELDFRISASRTEDDGFESRTDSAKTNAINFRGDYSADSKNSLLIEFGHSSGVQEEGFPGHHILPTREAYHINHYQLLRWNRQIHPEKEFSVQLYHNYQKKDDHFEDSFPPPIGTLSTGFGFDSHRYDGELQLSNRLNEQLRLVTGIGGRYESGEGVWVFDGKNPSRSQLRAFVSAEWIPRPDTVFNLGAMYEDYQDQRGLLSPRIAVNHHLNALNTLRFVASRAYRMPTLWESNSRSLVYRAADMTPLDYDFLTLDNLKPEEISAYEVGYLGKSPDNSLILDFRLFSERIRNLIPAIDNETILGPGFLPHPNAAGAQSYVNDGALTINGLELELQYQPSRHSLVRFGYSLADARGKQLQRIHANGSLEFSDLAASVPRQTFSLLGSYRFANGLEISSAYYYVDPMEWQYQGDPVPAYKRWDVRFGKIFYSPEADINLEFIAQNIDGDDSEFHNAPDAQPPRINISEPRYFLQASISFH